MWGKHSLEVAGCPLQHFQSQVAVEKSWFTRRVAHDDSWSRQDAVTDLGGRGRLIQGGDSVIGLPIPDVALLFEEDDETDAIVVFGEIGGSQEERLADLVTAGAVTKPIIAYIGGAAAREGTRFSHAGAIIDGNRGTHAGKTEALREAGGRVVDAFGDLPDATRSVLESARRATKGRSREGAERGAL